MFEPVSGKIKIVGVPNGGAFLAVGVGRYCAARERSFWVQCLIFPSAAVSFRSRVRRLTNDARSHALLTTRLHIVRCQKVRPAVGERPPAVPPRYNAYQNVWGGA